jgi:hypothetical protein
MSGGSPAEPQPPSAKRMRVAAGAAGEGGGEVGAAGYPRRAKPNALGSWADAAPPALAPAWLVKSQLGLPGGAPSPGALQGCRVALQVRLQRRQGERLRLRPARGARLTRGAARRRRGRGRWASTSHPARACISTRRAPAPQPAR